MSLALVGGCVGGGGSDKDSGTTPSTDATDHSTMTDMPPPPDATDYYGDSDVDVDADADADTDVDADSDADTDTTGGSGTITIEPLYGVITTGGTGSTTTGGSGGSGLVTIDSGGVEPLYGVTTTPPTK